MGGSGLFKVFGGAMDKESIRVVAGGKRVIIDASCFVYKYVIAAGTCAADFLDRGDVSGMVTTWTSIVRHFKALPIGFVWSLDGPCAGKAKSWRLQSFSALFFD